MTLGKQKLDQYFQDNPDITQKTFSLFIGCSDKYISDLKLGKKTASMKIAKRIEYFTEGAVKISDWANEEE